MGGPAAPGGPVLASFAHPDDAEISAGGCLAKWTAEGREVHLLVLTNGDRGSSDPRLDRAELARTRTEEVVDAGRVLGLAGTHVLATHDGELENTTQSRAEIARRIREIRPTTVLTCDPTAWFFEAGEGATYYNHADHRVAGEATLDAIFPGAGNPHYFTDQIAEGFEPWSVSDVWLGWTKEPNHVEDISEHFATKVEALGKHASQLGEGIAFWGDMLGEEARSAGAEIGVEFGERFRRLDLVD
jgi:LmbE family N-acetylglucosaminyl deacetylase